VRQILRLLGTRYGLALILMVLVVGVVTVLRAVNGGPDNPPATDPVVAPPPASVDASHGDDSVATPESPPAPSVSAGTEAPESVAVSFAQAWLDHNGVTGDQWRQRLKPLATESFMRRLAAADPAGVPADRMTGPARVVVRTTDLVEVSIPVDSGVLRLRLVGPGGRWLVDGVDWERA